MAEPGSRDEVDSLVAGLRTRRDDFERRRLRASVTGRLFGSKQPVKIDRFVVLGTAGTGGAAVVYHTYDPELDRKVALKLLRTGGDGEVDRRRLIREARAMAQLSHPNVVSVFDVGTVEDNVFIAMEYVEGLTLRQWLDARRPPWREVLKTFRSAALGLGAAHDAGIVHRDFKPANVLICDDGRVQVADFGLAVGVEGEVHPATWDDEDKEATVAVPTMAPAQRGAAVATPTGWVMGTPPYMAPEQHEGTEAGPHSDQFAFCVALWEGLYGRRPYTGPTVTDIVLKKLNGPPPEPARARAPTWVYEVVARGLSPRPDHRWPSMAALLAELERIPRQRRRWIGIASMGSLTLGAGALVLAWPDPPTGPQCRGADELIARAWSVDQKGTVRAALLVGELSYAESTWARVEPGLDGYAAAWAQMHREACEATQNGEQSESLLDLRMTCLRRSFEAFDDLVAILLEPDDRTTHAAVEAVDGLPPLALCADTAVLESKRPEPSDGATRIEADRIRSELTAVWALSRAGQTQQALRRARATLAAARELGYLPVEAEALLAVGRFEVNRGRVEEGHRLLMEAAWVAQAEGHNQTAFDAAYALVHITGERTRFDEAQMWTRAATAALQRANHEGSEDHGALLITVGWVLYREGRNQDALEKAREGLALIKDDVHSRMNGLELEGGLELEAGRIDQAHRLYEEAIELNSQHYGPDHPHTATALNNAGEAYYIEGDYERARQLHQDALIIEERAHRRAHSGVAGALTNLGNVCERMGDYPCAEAYHRRAVVEFERSLGGDSIYVALPLNNLGEVHRRTGDLAQAQHEYERSIAIFDAALSTAHPHLAYPLTGLGEVHLARGEPSLAKEPLERALSIRHALDVDPRLGAETEFALARALMGLGQIERALRTARRARDGFLAAGRRSADEHHEVVAWLGEQGDGAAARPEKSPRPR